MAQSTRPAAGPLPAGVDQARTRLVPAWLRGAAAIGWRVLVTIALGAVLARLAIALSTAVLAVVVGVVIAATFSPLVRTLRARGWTRARAAAVASVMSLVFVLIAALLIVLAFVPYLGNVAALAGEGTARIEAELRSLGIPPSVVDGLGRMTAQLEASAPDAARSLVGPVGTLVTVMILGGFLTFYLLEDADRAWAGVTAKLDRWQTDTLDARAVAATAQVGAYLRGMALTAAITGVTQAIYLVVLGVPFAGPLAVFVFVGAFVPYLGAIVTTVVLLLITLATAGGGAALALLALIGATAVARRQLLARRVYAGATRVHPALVLVVAPAGAALFGLAGLLLAVPVAAAVIAFAPAIVTVLGNPPGTPPAHAFVPPWLDQVAQWSWRVLVIVGVLAVAAQTLVAPFLTAPVVVALVIACAAKPAFDAVRARGLGPTAAALAVTLTSALIVVAILVVTVSSLAQQLPAILDEAIAGAGRIVGGAGLTQVLEMVQGTLLDGSRALLENIASISLALVSAALLTFFFVRDGPGWWAALLDHLPAAHRRELGESGARAAMILNGSTFGTGVVSAIAGALQFVMMTVLGLPLAFPIGVLTFFGGFIPYIGGFIASGVAFLVAVAVGGPTTVALMAVLTVVNNILIGNFVAPLVLGRTVHVHPAVVLLAAPVGAAIGGLVGLILIVPAIAIFGATWRSIANLFDPGDGTTAEPGPDLLGTSATGTAPAAMPAGAGGVGPEAAG